MANHEADTKSVFEAHVSNLYRCEICSAVFKSSSALTGHKNSAHQPTNFVRAQEKMPYDRPHDRFQKNQLEDGYINTIEMFSKSFYE